MKRSINFDLFNLNNNDNADCKKHTQESKANVIVRNEEINDDNNIKKDNDSDRKKRKVDIETINILNGWHL